MSERVLLVEGEDGTPSGLVELDAIDSAALELAFGLAAHCEEPDTFPGIVEGALAGLDGAGRGYVCAAALRLMAADILAPLLEVASEVLPNFDMRAHLRETYVDAWRANGGRDA